ncbi:MAG TPA: DUF72 domain-containing protein [Chthoniobacterales bacterium]|nr:DUF72 domain-containing protein [Chthoniobacterales bacterium]
MSENSSARILVGTASWSDPGFVERWYPAKMAAADRLPWYAQHFDLVEVNSSFYAIPDRRTVERWCRATPDGFTFDVKVHKLLSRHAATVKSLPPDLQRSVEADAKGKVKLTAKTERALLEEVVRSVEPLLGAGKFGAFLLQLSPAFSPRKHDLGELGTVIERLGSSGLVVELRNRNWMKGEQLAQTLEFFNERGVALCLVDAPDEEHFTIMPSEVNEVTNPQLCYLRLHGRNAEGYLHGKTVAERFYYDYGDEEIEEVAERARQLAREAKKVHVIFNNNALDFAPHAASRLRVALGQIAKTPARQAELFG